MSTLEVRAPGALATLQDTGRHGWRRIGVPTAGALDLRLLRLANALVGNPETAVAIECFDGGQQFVARDGALRVAVAGDARLEHHDRDGRHALAGWRSLTLAEGDTLRLVDTGAGRLAMLAVAGLAVAPVMGSASTYTRAALGGIDGRPLQAGDRLCAAAAVPAPPLCLPAPPAPESGPIRIVPGPQADHFTAAAHETLFSRPFTVTAEADRMGVRLRGPALAHCDAAHAEIVSDAIVPGAIQVPGNGQPIVLLADSQTAGGYPKIGVVISADRARIAALRPGSAVRFAPLGVADAEAAARAAAAALRALIASIAPCRDDIALDIDALYRDNLLSGVVDARAPDAEDTESPE